jgi:DNA-directed RNA polymerase specialized sigma24 family protein
MRPAYVVLLIRISEGERRMPHSPESVMNPGVTGLLRAWGQGDKDALETLAPLVENELRNLARKYLRREWPGQPLQTTELVSEVYLRLIDSAQVSWQDRAHFFAASARMMRNILTDFARSRSYLKRGGAAIQVTWDETLAVASEREAWNFLIREKHKWLNCVFLRGSASKKRQRFSKFPSKRSCAIGSSQNHG